MTFDGTATSPRSSCPTGQAYRFRYLIDNDRWMIDWEADRYAPNELGGGDSVLDLTRPRASLLASTGIRAIRRITPRRHHADTGQRSHHRCLASPVSTSSLDTWTEHDWRDFQWYGVCQLRSAAARTPRARRFRHPGRRGRPTRRRTQRRPLRHPLIGSTHIRRSVRDCHGRRRRGDMSGIGRPARR